MTANRTKRAATTVAALILHAPSAWSWTIFRQANHIALWSTTSTTVKSHVRQRVGLQTPHPKQSDPGTTPTEGAPPKLVATTNPRFRMKKLLFELALVASVLAMASLQATGSNSPAADINHV